MPAILTKHRPRPRLTFSSLLIYDEDGNEHFKHRSAFRYSVPLHDTSVQVFWTDGPSLTLDRDEWTYLRHAWHVS